MRLGILALILSLCSPIAASASEIGAQLAFPIAAGDVGDHERGIQAGFTGTWFDETRSGIGLDVAYHYWPVSAGFKAGFESQLYGLLEIGDPNWNISALQTTAHIKAVAPFRGAARPWLQIGAGGYRVDPMLQLMGQRLDAKWEAGANVALGFDYDANPRLRLGLDVSYHSVWMKHDVGAYFNAFEMGMHLLFGRP